MDNRTQKERKDEMLKSLKETLGIVSAAAEKTRITPQAHYKWMKADAKYAAKVNAIQEVQKDFVETKFMQLIRECDTAAIIFYMKTKAKDRGYGERMEITGRDGSDLLTQVTVQVVNKRDATDD